MTTSTLIADPLSFAFNSQGATNVPPRRTLLPAILR